MAAHVLVAQPFDGSHRELGLPLQRRDNFTTIGVGAVEDIEVWKLRDGDPGERLWFAVPEFVQRPSGAPDDAV